MDAVYLVIVVTITAILIGTTDVVLNGSVRASSANTPLAMPLPTVTPQAALTDVTAAQTNNIATTTGYYDVIFSTSQFGRISLIQVDFPTGTDVSNARLIEVSGISDDGTTTIVGQTITYEIAKATPIQAGQEIRLEFADVVNPPDGNYQVTVTTKDKSGMIIDGPTLSSVYSIIQTPTGPVVIPDGSITNEKLASDAVTTDKIEDGQVTTSDLADGAVTTDKIATNAITHEKIQDSSITSSKPSEGFMKRVTLLDNAAGNAMGWNPDGATIGFLILEPDADFDNSYVSASVTSTRLGGGALINAPCTAAPLVAGNAFRISCGNTSPQDGSELHYMIINLPAHVS